MPIDKCKSSKNDADAIMEHSIRQAVNLFNRVGISLVHSPAEHSFTKLYVERYFVNINTGLSHTSPGKDKGVKMTPPANL